MRYIPAMDSAFEIIAEPNRRAILSLLVSSEQSVGEIERQLRMPQRRLYRLKPEPFRQVDAWLDQFRRFWSAHIDALERHLDRMDQSTSPKKENKDNKTRPKPRT